MTLCTFRNGSALITCMIVVALGSALAVALAGMSGTNLQIADNQREANRAFANAESGLEVMRYWLGRVRMPSTTPPAEYLSTTITYVQDDLQATGTTNFVVNDNGSIPPVVLANDAGQVFSGQWSSHPDDPAIVRVAVTGTSGPASRTIMVDFRIEPYRFPIFNYGVATRGALRFPRNPTLTGEQDNWEADIYIESSDNLLALECLGNANFDGNIDIGNPLAHVDFQRDVQIAGDTGQDAIDKHVTIGAEPVEFPVPDVSQFEPYATGTVIDPNTDVSGHMTLVNATIQAGTNPTFGGNVTIQGILYIESSNIVTFNRNVSLQGMIVGDGDVHNPGTNQITFAGNFESGPYPSGSQFDAIRSQEGSTMLVPGFGVSFTGNFSAVNGVMAASGMYFSGNASADVKGTLISYSPDPTFVDGNISINFDRSAMVEIPAGFDVLRVLTYEPTSYALAL